MAKDKNCDLCYVGLCSAHQPDDTELRQPDPRKVVSSETSDNTASFAIRPEVKVDCCCKNCKQFTTFTFPGRVNGLSWLCDCGESNDSHIRRHETINPTLKDRAVK
jgi:hypothetical protein